MAACLRSLREVLLSGMSDDFAPSRCAPFIPPRLPRPEIVIDGGNCGTNCDHAGNGKDHRDRKSLSGKTCICHAGCYKNAKPCPCSSECQTPPFRLAGGTRLHSLVDGSAMVAASNADVADYQPPPPPPPPPPPEEPPPPPPDEPPELENPDDAELTTGRAAVRLLARLPGSDRGCDLL